MIAEIWLGGALLGALGAGHLTVLSLNSSGRPAGSLNHRLIPPRTLASVSDTSVSIAAASGTKLARGLLCHLTNDGALLQPGTDGPDRPAHRAQPDTPG